VNTIKKIGIKGVGPYKQGAVFTVPQGITYLYGRNELRGGNGNASGKSVFASALAEIFYDQPIIGTRQDRAKSGSRFVEYKRGKDLIRISSAFKGRSEKLEVLVNGQSKSGRTGKLTKELISRLWPVTETEYLSYGFLDSNLPHPLVRGSTTERKAFFTSFFGLDKLDAERKLFASELLKVKRVKAAYAELESTFKTLKLDMLSREQRVKIEQTINALDEKISILRADNAHFQNIKQLIEFETYAAKQIKELKDICPDLAQFESYYKTTRTRLAKAEARAEQLEDWKAYKRDLEVYKRKTENLDLTKSRSELEAAAYEYKTALAQSKSINLTRPEAVDEPKLPQGDKQKALLKLAEIEHRIEHATKFGKGVCYACGQDVKVESRAVLDAELKRIKSTVKQWDVYESQSADYSDYKKELAIYKQQMQRVKELAKDVARLKPDYELWQQIKDLHKPQKVEKPSDVEDAEPIRKKLAILEFCRPHVDTIIELSALDSKDRKIEFDPEALNKMQDRVSALKAKLEVHNTVKARASDIRTRLQELESEAAKEKALNLLVEAYSDKAIKKMVIESISQHLMKLVNKYASLVFDNYQFEFVWGTQIQILVHRPEGTTDVRKLSGAESKLFTIVLVLSMLAFVPRHKRLSLLVLDEPTASFSEETVELFHKLLPHLNNLIPSVLIITPDARERLAGANEYTVLRNREGAKIVSGHPSQF
jgi:DNA repair exonuclease SbcCD ATPase subunit